MLCPFVSNQHFLDLVISDYQTKNTILENLVKEKCYITKFLHTSYLDIDEITRIERNMLLKFIKDDKEQEARQIKNLRNRT
jgi:hypothetical protein